VTKRILVVDDDADVAEPLAILLSRTYDVDLAANGADAVRRIERGHYDAIVLDLVMPVMDGSSFKAWLDGQGLDIPVVLVSGSADLVERAQQLGVADHFAKPLDTAALRARLAAILDRPPSQSRIAGSASGAVRNPALAAQGGGAR
jgi:DNA-binding response OmpR family regulator